jgi:hypothetical protein
MNTNNVHPTVAIETEKRIALAQNPEFIAKCVEIAKQAGVTAKEWNANKVLILMLFANRAVQAAQEMGLDTFGQPNTSLSF